MVSRTSSPRRHEQQKVDKLLVRLSKMKSILPKTAAIVQGKPAIRAACTANVQVFFST